jgi:4-amino-4-deoxy-L-arabinose transferase-like glycosyltransferase
VRRALPIAIAAALVLGLLGLRAALHEEPWDHLTLRPDGSFTGRIHLPRDGRYVFGCQCDATLTVAGKTVRAGQDGRPVDLFAGTADFAVKAPRGARLLWHPPGRRGPLEYLPAAQLAPDPPGGVSLDGAIAVAIVVVVVALAVFLARHRLRAALTIHRSLAIGAAAVFVVALGVRLWDLGGAGQTWDEDVNWAAGRNYVSNLVALDFAQRSWVWNYEHPPVMKYVAGLGAHLGDGYGPARALSALMVALGCALLVPIGARLWSWRAGVAAGAIAALTPHLVAHGKVVGHEAPTVLWWTLGLWLCLRAFDGDERHLARRFAGIGVVLGLAVFSRFVNLLLAPLLGVALLASAPAHLRRRTVALGLAVLPVVALAVGFLLWPRLWSDPIGHLGEAWEKLSKPHSPEPFLGARTAEPPRYYFLAYLYATAPLGVLVGVGAALARFAARRTEWRATVIVLALFAVPLVAAFSPVRQDGVRYVMPSVVALALLAGAGLDQLATWLRHPRAYPALLGAAVLYLAIVCARIHPYYLDYYGEQVGGPAGVARTRSFELGWWGEGLHEATAYVAAHAGPGDRVHRECVEAVHVAWFHGDAWAHLERDAARADWIVVQPALGPCRIPGGFDPVFTARAQGAPLVRVYRRAASD